MSSVLHSPTLPQYRFTEMKFTNAMIVLEGLTGKPVTEVCIEHQKNHSQYDQWPDQCLINASKASEV